MIILAHRGNLDGPDRKTENTREVYEKALGAGFGLEIDVRRDAHGRFYISHDVMPWTQKNSLDGFKVVFRAHAQSVVAVNVKELGYENELAELVRQDVFGQQSFLFDFELLEPSTPGRAQRLIRSTVSLEEHRLASRVSDHGESIERCLSIPAKVTWVDEFERFWLTEDVVCRLRAAGRKIFVISPELHGFDGQTRLARWGDFKQWRVDGICTDFAMEAREFFWE